MCVHEHTESGQQDISQNCSTFNVDIIQISGETKLNPIDFLCMHRKTLFHRRKKVLQFWNGMRLVMMRGVSICNLACHLIIELPVGFNY